MYILLAHTQYRLGRLYQGMIVIEEQTIMDKLDYCLSLRIKGLYSSEIKRRCLKKGFDESEIENLLKVSDDLFLNQSYQRKENKFKRRFSKVVKTFILVLNLWLLIGIFFGYAYTGIIGLIIIWVLISMFGAFSSRTRTTYLNSRFSRHR